jgi:hypothetical protein
VTVVVNGQILVATVSGTTWSVAVPATLPDGIFNPQATATDNAGNSDTTTSGLTVDTTPPVVTVNSLVANNKPTLTGTVTDPAPSIGAAWIVMKPLVWHVYGIPVTAIRNLRSVPGRLQFDPSVPIDPLALRWVLTNPFVTTTVPTVNSIQAVREDTAASGQPPLSEEDIRCLAEYAAATTAEDIKPLSIAGMLENNLRVRGCAMHHLAEKFHLNLPDIDFAADDTPSRMRTPADTLLRSIRVDTKYSDFFESAQSGSVGRGRRSVRAECRLRRKPEARYCVILGPPRRVIIRA